MSNSEIHSVSPSNVSDTSAPESPPIARDSLRAVADQASGQDESGRRGLPIWLFALLVVLSAIVLGWQLQVAGQLETKIVGLEQELHETEAILSAHQSRLGEIRSSVRDLIGQLGGLQALVDSDPAAALAGSSRRSDEASTDSPDPIPARLPR